MYIKANNDIINIDKFIRAEYTPATHNNSQLTLVYTVDGATEKEPYTTSVFSNISKNCMQLLADALKNNKNYVDLSKNA